METKERIAKMLTENTGTHILDSGGAYGRHWEQNQGKTVEVWEASPAVTVDDYGITLSLFHFLADRLSYDEDMAGKLSTLESLLDGLADGESIYIHGEYLGNDYSWMDLVKAFPLWLRTQMPDSDIEYVYGANTYNNVDCLSQVIQYDVWSIDREPWVILQIHGGCDVRGGYTRPEIFKIEGEEYELADNAAVEAYLDPYVEEPTQEPLPIDLPEIPIPDHQWWASCDGGYSWDGDSGQSTSFYILDLEHGEVSTPAEIQEAINEKLSGRMDYEVRRDDEVMMLARKVDESKQGGYSPNVFVAYDKDAKRLGDLTFSGRGY